MNNDYIIMLINFVFNYCRVLIVNYTHLDLSVLYFHMEKYTT